VGLVVRVVQGGSRVRDGHAAATPKDICRKEESVMGLEIKAFHLGDILMDWSFLLFGYKPGRKTCIPINNFLILGAEKPILVDTGVFDFSVFSRSGFDEIGFSEPEQDLVRQLHAEGIEPDDVGCIIQTHLDIDHTGNTHRFPNARVVVQRKEMAYAASYGYGHAPDLPWFVSNVKQIDFIDGDMELFDGIKCVLAPAHTAGHQHVEVETNAGKVIVVGDTVYDIPMQLEGKAAAGVMWPAGNVYNQAMLQDQLFRLKCELKKGVPILQSHGYEAFDRFGFGKKLSDKRRNYEGFPTMQWPPVE
jgi:glyoxylase-like metal-dependent hydrolase (beta-lactamase superfamily II)